MHPRILIVGPDTHVLRLAAELMALESESYTEAIYQTESNLTVFAPENALTNLPEIIKFMPPEEPRPEDRADVLAGIEELRAWLANKIRQMLDVLPVKAQHQTFATIFQPCWSANRFKSLT